MELMMQGWFSGAAGAALGEAVVAGMAGQRTGKKPSTGVTTIDCT